MQIKRMRIFFSLYLLCFTHFLAAQDNKVIRAAIDIGMGGPKLQVAEIDTSTNQIVKILHTQRYFVNFYDSISKNEDGQLSSDIMEEGLKAFKEAINKAKTFNTTGMVAIATASLRSATNGMQFANRIQNETGVPVHIVDQSLEGKLAFQAVLSKTGIDDEKLVVWDVGGGSIQLIAKTPKDSYIIDCREEGVGAFNDYIIEHVQDRNKQDYKSPNPMSSQDIIQSTAYARGLAEKVDNTLKEKINHGTTSIVGAGSVFGFGIAGLLANKTSFNIEDLALVVQALSGKTDADLGGGDYAFCEGSNAVLVLGFMQALNIKQMQIINVNNADGALTYHPFWE